jgi:hypothetical protein
MKKPIPKKVLAPKRKEFAAEHLRDADQPETAKEKAARKGRLKDMDL